MIRPTELYLIRNLELFKFRMMKEEYKQAEVAYSLLETLLREYNLIDENSAPEKGNSSSTRNEKADK